MHLYSQLALCRGSTSVRSGVQPLPLGGSPLSRLSGWGLATELSVALFCLAMSLFSSLGPNHGPFILTQLLLKPDWAIDGTLLELGHCWHVLLLLVPLLRCRLRTRTLRVQKLSYLWGMAVALISTVVHGNKKTMWTPTAWLIRQQAFLLCVICFDTPHNSQHEVGKRQG